MKIPLTTNAAGQYVLNVMKNPIESKPGTEGLISSSSDSNEDTAELPSEDPSPDIAEAPGDQPCLSSSSTPHHVVIQCREDFGLTKTPVSLAVHDSKFWQYVFKRVVVDKDSNKVLYSELVDPKKPRKLLLRDVLQMLVMLSRDFICVSL